MRRGVATKWWNRRDDNMEGVELWVERTDLNEVQVTIAGREGQDDCDLYLKLDEAEQLDGLLTDARNERWK